MDSDGKLLVNLTRGSVVCDQLAIADKAGRRMRGLLGRESLRTGEGMLLQPTPSIHTAFMRFPIDAVFVDGTLRVKKIVAELKPWRVASAHGAWAVVELAAGEAGDRGIEIDDQLGVIEVTDRLGAFMANSAIENGGSQGASSNGSTRPQADGEATSPSWEREGLNGGSPRTRVLLVAADRRFRSVAAALLTRRGCAVTLADRSSNVAQLARREVADVVVLDAGVSLTDAAHTAAQIELIDPPISVVVVADAADHSLPAMPVLPKWGSFEGLYEAIESASSGRTWRSGNGSRD